MYRAHFALPPELVAPDGQRIGAVHGYLDMVTRLITRRRPDEVVHVYDHDWRPLARTQIFAGYKARRPDEPDELTWQFELLRQVLDLAGAPQAHAPDWEAEDAIGALCASAVDADRIEIVSGDRDLIQLVRDPHVKLLYTVRGVSNLLELDEPAVLEKYGIPAARYADFAILRGDPSDELPGVPGVGEKTARALVLAYPDLDALLEDAARSAPEGAPLRGKPALRARLRDSAEYVAAMRLLVPINSGADLATWADDRDDPALRDLADANNLKGPVQRMLAALDSAS
jgi:5'-3' exonuclease